MSTMNDNYDDKDIEKIIFGGGLASYEIEPSENFWNRAYEDILQRESHAKVKRDSRRRGIFIAMGTAIVLLGSYAVYMHNEVNDIKQHLTVIESTHLNSIK